MDFEGKRFSNCQFLTVCYELSSMQYNCIFCSPESKAQVNYCHSASSVRHKLSHFGLLLWNCLSEFNETWKEARSRRPLSSLCFLGWLEKVLSSWLAETFSTSPLKPLKGIWRNLTGSKISTSSTKFVFFGRIGKPRWLPQPLIGWDIFDFSETKVWNSTKLDRKQEIPSFFLADQ